MDAHITWILFNEGDLTFQVHLTEDFQPFISAAMLWAFIEWDHDLCEAPVDSNLTAAIAGRKPWGYTAFAEQFNTTAVLIGFDFIQFAMAPGRQPASTHPIRSYMQGVHDYMPVYHLCHPNAHSGYNCYCQQLATRHFTQHRDRRAAPFVTFYTPAALARTPVRPRTRTRSELVQLLAINLAPVAAATTQPTMFTVPSSPASMSTDNTSLDLSSVLRLNYTFNQLHKMATSQAGM